MYERTEHPLRFGPRKFLLLFQLRDSLPNSQLVTTKVYRLWLLLTCFLSSFLRAISAAFSSFVMLAELTGFGDVALGAGEGFGLGEV